MPTTRLAAIMFTDIVGYTAMMGQNRETGMAAVKLHEATLKDRIARHGGELLQTYGDGSLSIFESASAAVQSAWEIQEQLRDQVPLRIGLHIGEITRDADHTFGDGVNVASRIESIGVAGAILFSKDLYKRIRNRPEFAVQSLGSFAFKNVEEPMEVFALANEGLVVPDPKSLRGKLKLPQAGRKRLNWTWALSTILVLALLAGLANWVWNSHASSQAQVDMEEIDKSIAVLPFRDMSEAGDQEYFGDGVAEEILNALAQLDDLKVIARTSSFSFKDKSLAISEIAEKLGVSTILEGSVRKSGGRLRITAQLINAANESHIWSESYDRTQDDVFAIQEEIAQAIAEKFYPDFSIKSNGELIQLRTHKPEAYEAFIKGRVMYWSGYPTDSMVESLFLEAIRLDHGFSNAYSLLAGSRAWRVWKGLASPEVGFSEALQILRIAKNIDPDHKENLTASIKIWHEWDWEGIPAELKKLRINNGPRYEQTAATYYDLIGQSEKAFSLYKIAFEKDPQFGAQQSDYIYAYINARQYDQALALALQFEQDFPEKNFKSEIALIYYLQGKYEKIIALARAAESMPGGNIQSIYPMEIESLARIGKIREAIGLYDQWKEQLATSEVYEDPLLHAFYLIPMGKTSEALDYLEAAYENRSVLMATAKVNPRFDPIRDEPRFQAIMEKMNFPSE